MKMLEEIRKAYLDFCAEYDRQPHVVYMSVGAYEKAKDESKNYVEPPYPHVARCFGANIVRLDVPGDLVIFGIMAIGKTIID